MTDTKTGKVKFFDNRPEKKFGFIVPDKRRPDGKEIFFHFNGGCKVIEEVPGELDFEVGTAVGRDPIKGDCVIYREADHQKGPAAFEWCYKDDWRKAQVLIATRPWPECALCRVVQEDKEPPHKMIVLWEGYYPLLAETICNGHPVFFRANPDWYRYIWCEEFKVQGWKRMWNPLDPELGLKTPVITPENRRKLECFKLAQLK